MRTYVSEIFNKNLPELMSFKSDLLSWYLYIRA